MDSNDWISPLDAYHRHFSASAAGHPHYHCIRFSFMIESQRPYYGGLIRIVWEVVTETTANFIHGSIQSPVPQCLRDYVLLAILRSLALSS